MFGLSIVRTATYKSLQEYLKKAAHVIEHRNQEIKSMKAEYQAMDDMCKHLNERLHITGTELEDTRKKLARAMDPNYVESQPFIEHKH